MNGDLDSGCFPAQSEKVSHMSMREIDERKLFEIVYMIFRYGCCLRGSFGHGETDMSKSENIELQAGAYDLV